MHFHKSVVSTIMYITEEVIKVALNIILTIIIVALIYKYWEEFKGVSAFVVLFILGTLFAFSLHLYHVLNTWYTLKKKDKRT